MKKLKKNKEIKENRKRKQDKKTSEKTGIEKKRNRKRDCDNFSLQLESPPQDVSSTDCFPHLFVTFPPTCVTFSPLVWKSLL